MIIEGAIFDWIGIQLNLIFDWVGIQMKRQPEGSLKKAIRDYLTLKGWLCIPIRSVGIYRKDTGKYIPMKTKGVSDIIAIFPHKPYAIPLAIEAKTSKGVLKPSQQKFLDDWNKAGGIGFVARDLDTVIKKVSSVLLAME